MSPRLGRPRRSPFYEKREAEKIQIPGMKVTVSEVDGEPVAAEIDVDHTDTEIGYQLISEAIGSENRDFLFGTIDSLAMAAMTAS